MSHGRRLLVLVTAGALLWLLAELVVRWLAPPQLTVPHMRVYPHGYYTWEPGADFTYHNLPGVDPVTARVRINSHGLRGGPLPSAKTAGEKRILVIGDSYTAAVQLPEDKIFTTLLQQMLSSGNRGGYQVMNAGFNGAGTAHELLYFLHRGISLEPDVAVLQFTLNDIEDNLRHGGIDWDGRVLKLSPGLTDPPFWKGSLLALRDFVGNNSLAFYLFYKGLKWTFERKPETRPRLRISTSTPEGSKVPKVRRPVSGPGEVLRLAAGSAEVDSDRERETRGVALTIELAKEFISAANTRGIPVIVLVIPWPLQFAAPDPSYERLKLLLQQVVRRPANRLVIMDRLFWEALREGKPVFLEHDGHLGEVGHELVANALAPVTREALAAQVDWR